MNCCNKNNRRSNKKLLNTEVITQLPLDLLGRVRGQKATHEARILLFLPKPIKNSESKGCMDDSIVGCTAAVKSGFAVPWLCLLIKPISLLLKISFNYK